MVHTFEIISNDDVFLHDAEISARPYIKSVMTKNGATKYAINPNKFLGSRLYALSDFESMLKLILEDLQIINYQFGRVDIAVDTTIPFEQCYKQFKERKEKAESEISEINAQIELLKIEQKHYSIDTVKNNYELVNKFENQMSGGGLTDKQNNDLYKSIIDCIIWTRKANIINIEVKFK
jgi:hypothetical protein